MIKIGSRSIGKGYPVYIIGEVGSNHDGSLARAKEYIKALAEIGCDAVKFQSFTAKGLFNKAANEKVYEILDKLSLNREWHKELMDYSREQGIEFLTTPFDTEAVDLIEELGIKAYKIASGDITHIPLIKHIASKKKPIFLATAMSTLGEVEQALEAIYSEGCRDVVLLQCVGLYPTDYKYSNINAMSTLEEVFKLPAGYSDHSPGDLVPVAAVAKGACVIEKHVTFSRDEKGPDHFFAVTIDEYGDIIRKIRNLEAAMGDGIKRPNEVEQKERYGARRCLVANRDIPAGTVVTPEMIDIVRPETGIKPEDLGKVAGKTAAREIRQGESLKWDMF